MNFIQGNEFADLDDDIMKRLEFLHLNLVKILPIPSICLSEVAFFNVGSQKLIKILRLRYLRSDTHFGILKFRLFMFFLSPIVISA